MKTRCRVLGRSQARNIRGERAFYTYLRLPDISNVIFTYRTAEELIPYGFRTAEEIMVNVDPDALHFDGYYWNIGEIEFVDVSWPTEIKQ